MKERTETFSVFAILSGYIILALLGINSYFIPNFMDNIFYFFLAESMIDHEGYQLMGQFILDWPPVYPACIAAAFVLFSNTLATAKIVTVVFAVCGLITVYRLSKALGYHDAFLIVLVMALLPTSLNMGVRVASEWPYLCFSAGFLLLLHRMQKNRTLPFAALAGLLLALSILTRYVGILLYVPLGIQLLIQFKEKGITKKAAAPELMTAITGAIPCLAWFYLLYHRYHAPEVAKYMGSYETEGVSLLNYLDVRSLGYSILDLFVQWNNVFSDLHLNTALVIILASGLLLLMAAGFFNSLLFGKARPVDYYVLAVLVVLGTYKWKYSRYILAIAPFLLHYFFMGCRLLYSPLKGKGRVLVKRTIWVLLTAWCLFLFAMDTHLIILGNRSTHNGLSPLASPTEESFYKGKWKEMYLISQAIVRASDSDSDVIGLKGSIQYWWGYLYAFTGLKSVPLGAEDGSVRFFVVNTEEHFDPAGMTLLYSGKDFKAYFFP